MSLINSQIEEYMKSSSWIRRMFEAASKLSAKLGAENIFDFSLGNPDVAPPSLVAEALTDIANRSCRPHELGYCPNAGLWGVREALADLVGHEQQIKLSASNIVVTCGAAGAINTIFRTILTPGDEVICIAPYFVEYKFYAANYGGILKPVKSKEPLFEIDLDALEASITPKTRVMILNSPNNPSGIVYTKNIISTIAALLEKKSSQYGKPILLVSDEPYRFLVYDGISVPAIFPFYPYSLIVSSFSKKLSLAGERIGYIAVNPQIEEAQMLLDGFILANRILGFVNAPIIGQYILLKSIKTGIDVSIYDERRKAMAAILDENGFEYAMPQGAFYFFPKVPGKLTDIEFVNHLMNENIITVPGTGFGYPGYFRIAYCVDKKIIVSSAPAWKRAMKKL